MVIYVVIMDEVMEFVFIKIKRNYHVCALSVEVFTLCTKCCVNFKSPCYSRSKLTHKVAKNKIFSKTNKFSRRGDVTSNLS